MAPQSIAHRRVLIGTVSNYMGKVISLGISFLLTPFILQQLGVSGYGLWVLVGTMIAYDWLLGFGIGDALVKYIAEHRVRGEIAEIRRLITTGVWLSLAFGVLIIALCAALAPIFPALFHIPANQRVEVIWLIMLVGLALGISIACLPSTAILRGLQHYEIINLLGTGSVLLIGVATAVILRLGGGVIGVVVVMIGVKLITQLCTLWSLRRVAPELRFDWNGGSLATARRIVSFGSAIFIGNVAAHFKSKTDGIVIGVFMTLAAVTPYAIALKLSEAGLIMTEQFLNVLLPIASELHAADDLERLRSLYIASTRLTLAIFLPIGCALVILARPILAAWVGAAYVEYGYLVIILTVSSLIETSQWPAGALLQGMARYRRIAVIAMYSGLVNLALSIILVHRLGLVGVALGTLVPTAIENLGIVLPYTMRTIGVSAQVVVKQILVSALLPVIPTAIVLITLRHMVDLSSLFSIAVVTAVGMLVYALGYLSVGASQVERQVCHNLALTTIRFTRARLGR